MTHTAAVTCTLSLSPPPAPWAGGVGARRCDSDHASTGCSTTTTRGATEMGAGVLILWVVVGVVLMGKAA